MTYRYSEGVLGRPVTIRSDTDLGSRPFLDERKNL